MDGVFQTTLVALSKFEIAFITLFAGLVIAKLVSKLVKLFLAQAELNRILTAAGFPPFSDTLGNSVQYILSGATIIIVLEQLGLAYYAIVFILGVFLLTLCFSILLALRDFIPNALAGFFLRTAFRKHLGQNVQIGIVSGTLASFGIFASILRNTDTHYIPHLYTLRNKIKRLRA